MFLRRLIIEGTLVAAALAIFGCDDGGNAGPKPAPVALPDEPAPEYGPGHLRAEQRGIALDEDDFAVITADGQAGIGADELGTDFTLLVANRPYVDWRSSICIDPGDAALRQPAQTTEALVRDLADARSVSFQHIAVNVDLLSPGRRDLMFVCYGEDKPRFDVVPHRQAVIEAFEDLARVDGVEWITVGLEMNRYYHLRTDDDRRLVDDYTNFITLYREVYQAIKAVDSDIKVGPGLSWAVFQRRTVPELAEEYGLEEDGMEAFFRAWERTVKPLLGPKSARTADFIGVSIIPFQSEAPFEGVPNPEDEADAAAIREYYRRLPVFADGLPVVVPQVDWAVSSASTANLKGLFLETLKEAISHVDLAWIAWRRTADLPATADASPCAKYTEAPEPTLAYPDDYCAAGLVSESGRRREVLDVLLMEP